jgi:hypothetical protein
MSKLKRKCSKCSKVENERFRFLELIWKCDLVLDKMVWKGILCRECHINILKKVENVIIEENLAE